jgi:hypothetical protein
MPSRMQAVRSPLRQSALNLKLCIICLCNCCDGCSHGSRSSAQHATVLPTSTCHTVCLQPPGNVELHTVTVSSDGDSHNKPRQQAASGAHTGITFKVYMCHCCLQSDERMRLRFIHWKSAVVHKQPQIYSMAHQRDARQDALWTVLPCIKGAIAAAGS